MKTRLIKTSLRDCAAQLSKIFPKVNKFRKIKFLKEEETNQRGPNQNRKQKN
jgi:hypothetical protein